MKLYHTYLYTFKETIDNKHIEPFMEDYKGIEDWYANLEDDDKEIIQELWKRIRHMFNRKGVYFNELDVDYDLSDQTQYDTYLFNPDTEMRLDDLLATIDETKDHYMALIKNQEALKNQILNDIQSESEHYFNDTPQTSGSGINNNYTSTYSKDITKLNIGPVSAKLEEVRLAMQDYYEQWTREFRKFILLSED